MSIKNGVLTMFINRGDELRFLEEKWTAGGVQLIVLWGKRRVGKTELVRRFAQNKPYVYFLAESTSDKAQLDRFSQSLAEFFNEPLLRSRGFRTWEESFQYLKETERRMILVIDEFPYMILSNPGIVSLFQKGWDEYLSKGGVYLVLLGSSVGMMETEVLGYRAPLYGRRTGQWKVQPMSLSAIGQFRKGHSFEDRLHHYAVAGGIPAYWLQFSNEKDFFHNLRDSVLRKGEMLYDEVEFLLREELREPRYYFALLQAIAQGKRKLSEIVNSTGLPQPTANKYLGVLSDLDIVEREVPVTEEKPLKSRKGLYRIKDEFFRFWFRFVFQRRSALEMGRPGIVIDEIRRELSHYSGEVYERAAREILLGSSGLPFVPEALGRWWDRNDEIDLVGINRSESAVIFCEAKWSSRPVGLSELKALEAKSEKVQLNNDGMKKHFALFSKSGFTDELQEISKERRILLFHGETLVAP